MSREKNGVQRSTRKRNARQLVGSVWRCGVGVEVQMCNELEAKEGTRTGHHQTMYKSALEYQDSYNEVRPILIVSSTRV